MIHKPLNQAVDNVLRDIADKLSEGEFHLLASKFEDSDDGSSTSMEIVFGDGRSEATLIYRAKLLAIVPAHEK